MLEILKENPKVFEFLCERNIFPHVGEFVFLVEEEDGYVKGILRMKLNGYDSVSAKGFKNWLNFITVRKEEQNKGVATRLIKAAYTYLEENGHDHILISAYTQEGREKIRKTILRIAEEHPSVKTRESSC